ncbi:MAG: selenocysteine-specific elongation factor [Thermoleophilaceae bacterium]|nr:selenocysteine-specific elongation factor [Thermoleophilaceae bacterium]
MTRTAPSDTPPLVLGTAGHIDHGKTALISVLTGTNTDRLPVERRRGISIELGYAPLVLPGGRRVSVVDVPGHERFVRTMVAGASGVDLYLLCVAADDGVMPQTREHAAVLRRLGVADGVVAVTKADVADPARAAAEIAELVAPGTPVVAVSSVARTGIDDLVGALESVASRLPGRGAGAAADEPARLHVDRSFTLRGIGTVVTGTLWSGSLGAGDPVRVLPQGIAARVRSVQVHDQAVERAGAGQRVALGLAGVGWREVGRGDVIAGPGSELAGSYRLDVAVVLEDGAGDLEPGARLHVHHGTRETPARLVPLGDGYAQLRLEQPLIAASGDRFVLRRIAPPDTIGGGEVVDPAPPRHGGGPEVVARLRGEAPAEETAAEPEPEPRAPAAAAPLGEAAVVLERLLRSDGAAPRTDAELAAAAELAERDAAEGLRQLVAAGAAVRVARNLHFHAQPLDELVGRVVAACERDGQATIAGVRDELGTSRKYAQALLEHLDREKVTLRRGDAHVLRRRRP